MASVHNPSLLKQEYLGPKMPYGVSRAAPIPYSENRTASYISNFLLQTTKENAGIPVEKMKLQKRAVTTTCLPELAADLQNHLEYRIQIFFYQMLFVYRTGLSFAFYDKADIQVGGGCKEAIEKEEVWEAAHSGTLPSLRLGYAGEIDDASVSFATGSFFYFTWNATIYLPKWVNQIDSDLDRCTKKVQGELSLRQTALNILNDVAAGEMSPAKGLGIFLEELGDALRELSTAPSSQERKIVLDLYRKTASVYQRRQAEMPFLQKLSFWPEEEKIDDRFYAAAQEPMHQQFIREMRLLRPSVVVITPLPLEQNWAQIRAEIENKLKEKQLLNCSGRAAEYKKICSLADKVQQVAHDFLIFLSQLPPTKRNNELELLFSSEDENSQKVADFREAALEAIKQQRSVQKPRNVPTILGHLLVDILSDVSLQPVLVHAELEKIQRTLQEIIAEKHLTPTPTTRKYQQMCATCDKVRELAKEFLFSLGSTPHIQLNQILAIKQSKTIGKIGLSPKALAFYKAALSEIRTHGPQNPRNMPTILMQLLSQISQDLLK